MDISKEHRCSEYHHVWNVMLWEETEGRTCECGKYVRIEGEAVPASPDVGKWHRPDVHPTVGIDVVAIIFDNNRFTRGHTLHSCIARYYGSPGPSGWVLSGVSGDIIYDDEPRNDLKILCWSYIDPPHDLADFCPLCRGVGETGSSSGTMGLCECQEFLEQHKRYT